MAIKMNEKTRFVFYILAIIVFLVCGFFVVTYAAGYKIDLSRRQISQTGIIDIQTDSQDSEIFVNGLSVGKGRATLRQLEARDYQIEVKRPDYQKWNKTVSLKTGEAIVLNGIILFKENPKIEEFNFDLNQGALADFSDRDNLSTQDGEIYQNGNLVSRFTKDVKGLCWYTDRHYLAFTQEGKLKIIELDGTNLIELLNKNSDSPVVFINGGRFVIFENDNKIFRAEIR